VQPLPHTASHTSRKKETADTCRVPLSDGIETQRGPGGQWNALEMPCIDQSGRVLFETSVGPSALGSPSGVCRRLHREPAGVRRVSGAAGAVQDPAGYWVLDV